MNRSEAIQWLKVMWIMYREFDCNAPKKTQPGIEQKMLALEFAIKELEAQEDMYEEK